MVNNIIQGEQKRLWTLTQYPLKESIILSWLFNQPMNKSVKLPPFSIIFVTHSYIIRVQTSTLEILPFGKSRRRFLLLCIFWKKQSLERYPSFWTATQYRTHVTYRYKRATRLFIYSLNYRCWYNEFNVSNKISLLIRESVTGLDTRLNTSFTFCKYSWFNNKGSTSVREINKSLTFAVVLLK